MSWTSAWFRIPAVGYQAFAQSLWPAAFLGFMACAGRFSRPAAWAAAGFLAFAAMRGVLAIAWSEHYRELAPLYHLLDRNQTALIVAAFVLVAALGYTWSVRLGALWSLAAVCVAVVLLLDSQPSPSVSGHVLPILASAAEPSFSFSPRFAILIGASFMVAAFVACAPITDRLRLTLGFGLCLPLVLHSSAVYAGFWWVRGPKWDGRTWLILVLIAAAGGLLTLASWVRARQSTYDGR
jgi:hypothetical protein